MPSFGMVLTLVAWGHLVDRLGERITLALGTGLAGVAAFAAAPLHSLSAIGALLFVGGMAAASSNVAGGRLVSGSFPPHQRGLAMGIRRHSRGAITALMAMPELTEIENRFAYARDRIAARWRRWSASSLTTRPGRPARRIDREKQLASPYRGSNVAAAHPLGVGAADGVDRR